MKKRFLSGLSLLLVLIFLLPVLPVMGSESQCEHRYISDYCSECGKYDSRCSICGEHCPHEWDSCGYCAICDFYCYHEQWDNGYCVECGYECSHGSWNYEGFCEYCGMECSHNWDMGMCVGCGVYCSHDFVDASCQICGYVCECRTYSDMYENGVCWHCGCECDHYYEDSVCIICNMACTHQWVGGYCAECLEACEHSYTDGSCLICGRAENAPNSACLSGEFNNWACEENMFPIAERYVGMYLELENPGMEEFTLIYQGQYWGMNNGLVNVYETKNYVSTSFTNTLTSGHERLRICFLEPISGRYLILFDTVEKQLSVCFYPEQMYLVVNGTRYPMVEDGFGEFGCTVTLEPGSYKFGHTDGNQWNVEWGKFYDEELTRTVDFTMHMRLITYRGTDGITYAPGLSIRIPPCEHSWKDGTCEICAEVCTHKWEQGTCTTCGMVCTHGYEEGQCSTCGMSQVPVMKLRYPTVSFEDEVKMNIYFTAEDALGVEEMGLAIYDSAVQSLEKQLIPGYTYDETAGTYCVSTPGIPAKELAQSITFSTYARLKDGTYVYSDTATYSPQNYALTVLKDENANDALKAATASLLGYSAAAQGYFGLEEGDTAVEFTEEMKAMIDAYREDMVQSVQKPDATKLSTFAATEGGFSVCYPTVSFESAFCINYYFTPSQAVQGDMQLYVWDQETYESAEVLTAENASRVLTMTPGKAYTATVSEIAAKDLNNTVYVAAVYSDGTNTHCSGVLAYSIGAYCKTQAAQGTPAMQALAAAVVVYGYHAKSYFG